MPRAVVFDLDDTLFAERQYAESGFRQVGRWLADHHGLATATEELLADLRRGKRKGAFDRLLARHGLPAARVSDLVALYRSHTPSIELRRGMRELLVGLRLTRPVGLLTDGPLESQRRKIEALHLEPLLDAVVINDERGQEHWKPNPSGFELIERLLSGLTGRPATAFCYVGDNPLKDFVAARGLGWVTVELDAEDRLEHRPPVLSPEYEADRVVTGVDELAGFLVSLD